MESSFPNPISEFTPESPTDQPSMEERRALIHRVAAYETISRSVRLRNFLLYIGKQALKDSSAEIGEEEIGVRVFGRSVSYDRGQDNIVRVNATELRKRIEMYFATVGAHESLIFEMPRGGYKLVFLRRFPEVHDEPGTSIEEPLTTVSGPLEAKSGVRIPGYLLSVLCAMALLLSALGIACAILFHQNRLMRETLRPWEDKPAVAALWTGFLDSNRTTDIVLPDFSIGLSKEITHHPVSLDEFLSHRYLSQIQSSDLSPDRRADLKSIFKHHIVTLGDVRAAQRILALDSKSSHFRLTSASFQEADSFDHDNTILIGGNTDNPWVYLFDQEMNFDLNYSGSIVNRHPQPGEQPAYEGYDVQDGGIGYSVVAYLPNPSGIGATIVIAGTGSDATSGAAKFLTSEDQLENFRKLLHRDRFPYFEVLLKTSQTGGTAFNAQIVAYRIHPELH